MRYIYKQLVMDIADIEKTLNDFGRQGWRLIAPAHLPVSPSRQPMRPDEGVSLSPPLQDAVILWLERVTE